LNNIIIKLPTDWTFTCTLLSTFNTKFNQRHFSIGFD
jgi:hypothetical protein